MMKKFLATTAFAALIAMASGANSATISAPASGGNVGSFGVPDSQTYGQVWQAPITGTLTSFTLYLNGGVGSLWGGVGTWNGSLTYGGGFGSPSNLYVSANVPSVAGGAYTFTPNISVTAGQNYVAYISAFGDDDTTNTTTMPLGQSGDPYLGHFVWNNSTDPRKNASWNYFFNAGPAEFSAVITAVPEPSTWAMMLIGFAGLGFLAQRKLKAKAIAA